MRKKSNDFLTGILVGLIICVFLFLLLFCKNVKAEIPTDVVVAIQDNERTEVSEEEIEMLAHLVKAEAGNQTFLGKQLVVDVVFNRMRSDKFPSTAKEVIYAPGQFSCVGFFMNKTPSEEDYEAVRVEIEKRQNREVIYFRTNRYGSGSPLFKEDDHYFSGL